MEKAVVLLSGGLDSATTLGVALAEGLHCIPIAFDYKQRHKKEVSSAYDIVAHYQQKKAPIEDLRVVSLVGLDLPTSSLTSDLAVPMGRDEGKMAEEIPPTYVPCRKSVFLSIGTGFAEALGAKSVWAGYNAIDYSGYPDCRPEYVVAMEAALALGTACGVEGNRIRIEAPIIKDKKSVIIEKAITMEVPLRYTWSCYVGQDIPCGECDSCIIRKNAFVEVGVPDPAL